MTKGALRTEEYGPPGNRRERIVRAAPKGEGEPK
jgi:hypothetical protein